ncbi:MAG: hypothetical protein LBP62_00270 [Clostridiales bacterium]|jgi:glycine cleavage system aminomethyltransferase T|nr:hypothetical protein [Clostridiales bacterium]
MKKTALYEKLLSLGGKFVEFGGFYMPVQFQSGILNEHKAVRNEAGIFDVSHMGEFVLEGENAEKDLNYLFTNDFAEMPEYKVKYTLMCNENGGADDDLLVYKVNEKKFYIVVNASNIDKDRELIKNRIKFGSVLTDLSDKISMIAVQGPLAEKLTGEFFKELPKGFYTFVFSKFQGAEILISRTGYTGEDGFEIYAENKVINNILDVFLCRSTRYRSAYSERIMNHISVAALKDSLRRSKRPLTVEINGELLDFNRKDIEINLPFPEKKNIKIDLPFPKKNDADKDKKPRDLIDMNLVILKPNGQKEYKKAYGKIVCEKPPFYLKPFVINAELFNAELAGLGARDTLRLESAMPLYGHEMNETTLASELGLDAYIKMYKDDFVGKSALLNTPPKYRRAGLKITGKGIAREHCAVFNGEELIGEVTSGTMSPTLGYPVAMARIKIDAETDDLTVDVRGKRLSAEIVKMPFYKRS